MCISVSRYSVNTIAGSLTRRSKTGERGDFRLALRCPCRYPGKSAKEIALVSGILQSEKGRPGWRLVGGRKLAGEIAQRELKLAVALLGR